MRFKGLQVKKIDMLLLKEFLPPFIMAMMIAMFVLMMQFLWLYIDDIAGKGIGLLVLAEMIYYMALTLIPMALPIAILLASVMVFGNLAEKYELPALKSSGISLMRIMRSSMVFSALIAISSFLCSNYVIPYANLKFRSRLYDIKKQKPALYLESGVFNGDFHGYSIRIGRKHADNKTIEDVMIDDDQSNEKNKFNFIRAKRGDMQVTPDDRYFIMNLEDGYQYQQAEPTSVRSKFPVIRTKFSTWSKTFDLGEFDLNRTDENLFKSYHAMLSTKQLADGIDTIQQRLSDLHHEATENVWNRMVYFKYQPGLDSTNLRRMGNEIPRDEAGVPEKLLERAGQGETSAKEEQEIIPNKPDPTRSKVNIVVEQPRIDSIGPHESLLFSYAEDKSSTYLDNARNAIRSAKNSNYEYRQKLKADIDRRQRYVYQLHSKYGFAVVCFIFLFIGAPMGAIVRKGGFGYPLLIAIFFFMFFVILTKLFEKLSRSNTMDALVAAWLPCAILFPLGLFLTFKAMNDSKVLNFDPIVLWLRTISQRWPLNRLFKRGELPSVDN